MAFISQYDIDMEKQNRMNQGLNMALQGFEGIEQNRRRALEQRRAQFDKDMQFAALGVTPTEQETKEMTETGYSKGLLDRLSAPLKTVKDNEIAITGAKNKKALYEADQLTKPVQMRDDYIKSIDSSKARAGQSERIKIGAEQREEERRIEREARKIENEKKKGLQEAAITDFEVADPNVIPSSKDAEEVKKLNAANKTFVQIGERASAKLLELDPKKPVEFAKGYKQLIQDVTEMRLQAKELANLGVLNGPDLKLVDETLGSVGLTDLAVYGREEAANRIKNAIATANQKLSNVAAGRGYKPKAAPQKQADPEDQAAINWAKSNPNDPRAKQILQLHGAN